MPRYRETPEDDIDASLEKTADPEKIDTRRDTTPSDSGQTDTEAGYGAGTPEREEFSGPGGSRGVRDEGRSGRSESEVERPTKDGDDGRDRSGGDISVGS